MKKIILPEDLNNFIKMLETHWGYYDLSNMTIIFDVNERLLNDINKQLFQQSEHNITDTPTETDEVVININNYKIIYRLGE